MGGGSVIYFRKNIFKEILPYISIVFIMDSIGLSVDSDAENSNIHECPRCKEDRYTSQFDFKNRDGDRYKICNQCRINSKEGRKRKEKEKKKEEAQGTCCFGFLGFGMLFEF